MTEEACFTPHPQGNEPSPDRKPIPAARSDVRSVRITGSDKRKSSLDDSAVERSKRPCVARISNEDLIYEDGVGPLSSTGIPAAAQPPSRDSFASGPSEGLFQHAHNFVISNANFVENARNVYTNTRSNEALQWLREYTMPGAEFDSSARDPPPRCHPGTRTTIIRRAQSWFGDSEREEKLMWLHGPAGVGKSAIIQTLTEEESKLKRLGASLFFSRTNDRDKPGRVFPTIAYQLAVRDRSYLAYISELMLDPTSLEKAIGEQFRRLIVEPFAHRNIRSGSDVWTVMLDGLDECGGEECVGGQLQPKQHSDRFQCEIVRLISSFVQDYPSIPIIWVIASRPEPHLKAIFSHAGVRSSFWEEDVPVDSDEACRDVERYLLTEFDEIRQRYPDHISSPTWPAASQFLQIAQAASGLFAFASVVIRFVDDPWISNPITQLDSVLSMINRLTLLPDQRNPLIALDMIYEEILRKVPFDMWKTARLLIATSISLGYAQSTLIYMCNVLDITQDAAVTALRHLHSVLQVPRAGAVGKTRFSLYHTSFRDYLRNPSRSHEYAIDSDVIRSTINKWWWGCFRIMQQAIATPETIISGPERSPQIDNITLSWIPAEKAERTDLAKRLLGSARYLWGHLVLGKFSGDTFQFDHPSSGYNISISESELLRILEEMDFSKLVGGYLDVSSLSCDDFFWTSTLARHFPEELEQRRILSYIALGSLDINSIVHENAVCFTSSLADAQAALPRRRYIGISKYSDGLYEYEIGWRELLERVTHWVQAAPFMEVMVWGCSNSKRCVVFKVTEQVPKAQHVIEYTYILPYP